MFRPNAHPLFIAEAANHKPVSLGCVVLYDTWNEAGKPAEMHVYSKGKGGFGMREEDCRVIPGQTCFRNG
jgi:hypothetical protein